MKNALEILAEFTLDAWLLARNCVNPTGDLIDGRVWERSISDLLRRPGLTCRQGPGTTTLFGFRPASGIRHEIDSAAAGSRCCIILESKSQQAGVTKEDAALFHQKTLDFYCERPEAVKHECWWRILVSSSPVPHSVRKFCIHLGLLLCDPVLLPLPVLVRTAYRPSADQHLRETLLQEVLRLGETALIPIQTRWPYDPVTCKLMFKPKVMSANDMDDLFWLQDELGSDILDLYELHRPGTLERRGMLLFNQLRKTA